MAKDFDPYYRWLGIPPKDQPPHHYRPVGERSCRQLEQRSLGETGRGGFRRRRSVIRRCVSSRGAAQNDAAAEPRRVQQFNAHSSRVSNVRFSSDGKMILTNGGDAVTRVWDTRSWKELYSHSATGGGSTIRAEFSPDGQWLAIGGFMQNVDLCDAKSGERKKQLEGFVSAFAFSPDSKMLATSRDNIRLYDVASGQQKKVLAPNTRNIRFLAFSGEGDLLASLGDNSGLCIRDVASGAAKAIASESSPCTGLGFSEDGKRVMLGTRSQIKILDADTLRTGLALQPPTNVSRAGMTISSYMSAVCWSVDGGLLAGAWGQAIPIWNLRSRSKR